jgi:hypothetical protein
MSRLVALHTGGSREPWQSLGLIFENDTSPIKSLDKFLPRIVAPVSSNVDKQEVISRFDMINFFKLMLLMKFLLLGRITQEPK